MDYKITRLTFVITVLLGAIAAIGPQPVRAQSSYELTPAPDVWYNSVDGVRVGVRVLGQVPGTFGDGPHRLDAGVWLGTKFPDHPVSYYLKFTEPIPSISDFGNEGSISIESSYRTGFQSHGLIFDKRWQSGFEEFNYKELALGFRAENRFDEAYLLYPQLWQEDWLYVFSLNLDVADENGAGRYFVTFRSDANIAGSSDKFFTAEASFQQQLKLSDHFTAFGRIYSGFASEQAAPEYLFARSLDAGRHWMESGLTRARGTIPPAWIKAGGIQLTGGPTLRGYVHRDIQVLNDGGAPLLTSFSAVNLELDYPNPLNKIISDIPVLGDFLNLRSYLFYDGGTSLGLTQVEESDYLSDAGLGFLFSFNIPDYLGNPRGLVLRYDLPFWVSHPGDEEKFKFRHLVGIGAVISL